MRISQPPENSSVIRAEVALLEAEPRQHGARVRLHRVPAEVLEALAQPTVLREQALLVLARVVLGRDVLLEHA